MLPSCAPMAPAKYREWAPASGQIRRGCLAYRLAVLPGLGDGERLEVLLDPVGDLGEDVRPLRRRRAPPLLRRPVRRVQSQLDIGRGRPRDLTEHGTVDRRRIQEVSPL